LGCYLEPDEVGSTQPDGDAMIVPEIIIAETNIAETNIAETSIAEMIAGIVSRRSKSVFLIDGNSGREITYSEFHHLACALAAELLRRGVHKQDRVAVMLPNCCELAIFYFACIYAGIVIVPINPSLSKSDVEFILSNCKPSLVVTAESCSNAVQSFGSQVIKLAIEEVAREAPNAADQIRIEELAEGKEFMPLETATGQDLVAIMYTSGTSAKPKGLAHRLGSMFRNARAFAEVQQIGADTRFYLTLSMSYMGGFYNLLILPFLCGASVVVDHVFDARSSLHFWDKAKRNQVNALWLAPTVMSILLRMDRGQTGEEFCRKSVRHAFVGFAPLPLKVKNEFKARYGLRVIENYGLSETLFVTARSHGEVEAPGYVGEMLPGVTLRIVNDSGDILPPGAEGEVQILSPDLMAGYLDAGGALMRRDASGWFATGDVGCIDGQGSLFITGRKKDLIIRGGVNISPAAIEEALMQVSGISDVAVVSIPHELYGEDIVAVLKMEPGVELDSILDRVIAYAKQNLAQHQQPARYVTIDELPRTANGKVQKGRIRELVAEKLHVSSMLISERVAETAEMAR
jgi:long-chain acyl-CoA synthetase